MKLAKKYILFNPIYTNFITSTYDHIKNWDSLHSFSSYQVFPILYFTHLIQLANSLQYLCVCIFHYLRCRRFEYPSSSKYAKHYWKIECNYNKIKNLTVSLVPFQRFNSPLMATLNSTAPTVDLRHLLHPQNVVFYQHRPNKTMLSLFLLRQTFSSPLI